jgi:hypothetical protein
LTLEPRGDWIPRATSGLQVPSRQLTPVVDGEAGEILLYQVPSGELVGRVAMPAGLVLEDFQTVVGDALVLGVGGGEVVAFDIDRRTFVPSPIMPGGPVARVEARPAAGLLYVVRRDGVVEEWDIATATLVRAILTSGAADQAQAVPLNFDDRRALMLSITGSRPQLTDLHTGTLVGAPFPHDSIVQPGGADATGEAPLQLVTVDGSHLRVWNLDPDTWFGIACEAAGRNLTEEEWRSLGPRDRPPTATCPQWAEPA